MKTNQELIDAYLGTKKSKRTAAVYNTELQKFNHFVNKPFVHVDKWDIINFTKYIKEQTSSEPTQQRIYSTVRSFYKWLLKMGVIEEDPTTAMESFSPKMGCTNKSLTVQEVEAIKQVSYPHARNYALVAVLATTGIRISEAIGMNWNDIFRQDAEEGEGYDYFVHILRKGNKKQPIYLPEGTVKALFRLRRNRPLDESDDSPVFTAKWGSVDRRWTTQGARKILEQLAKKAGITRDFTPHWFRHTFITQCQRKGAPIRDIQWQAGHTNIETTEKYMWATGKGVGKFFPVKF